MLNKSIRLFFKQIHLYLSANIDILSSFRLAKKRQKNKKVLGIFELVEQQLTIGKSVTDSMEILLERGYIDSVCFSVISNAEKSGNLAVAFGTVFEYMENTAKAKGEIISSLSYPLIIIFSAFILILALVTTIFPKIMPLFASMHVKIPMATRVIVEISNFLSKNALVILVGATIIFVAIFSAYKFSNSFRSRFQKFTLKIPFLGKLFVTKELRRIAYSYSLLLTGGIPILECITLTNKNCSWLYIQDIFKRLAQGVGAGKRLSDVFLEYDIFEGEWNDLVFVGESTGTLPKSFLDISTIQSALIKDCIENVSKWSEPIALVGVAFVTLIVALSVVQPMYAIIQNVNQ